MGPCVRRDDVRWEHAFDRRDHHPESRQRPADGAALRPDRRRAGADLRPDGRGELRPWRIPHDRDVCDVLSVRVLCDRSAAGGAAGRGGVVRVRRGGLSPGRALCGPGQSQCRHGADLFDLRARHRHARPGAVLLHAGLSQRHAFLARRQNHLDCGHLPAGAAIGRRAGVDRGIRRAVFLHQPHRFRPRAGGDPRGRRRGGAGRHRQEQGVRAGLGPRRGAGRASPAP